MQQNNRLLTIVLLTGFLLSQGVYAEETNETLSRLYLQLQIDSGATL